MSAKLRRNWKRLQPDTLRQSMLLCKEYAQQRRNLSVEGIAAKMGLADHWSLYKWIENGRMPVVLIPAYESACGISFVTGWLAANDHKLLIEMPTGRDLSTDDVVDLHAGFATALGLLTDFYSGKAESVATLEALYAHLQTVAFHHANVLKYGQPEFEFGE
ncbi:hypothetical protein [Sapientia aquatica]|uniref:Uncharacterized protein n=1 Tax=Sapientia aquatica TaxID=1549640 RepID=A0A4R5W1P2_9BURK|nr:hypothetical protein [Sapientia aquatica]TDK66002.1 hypothetical protein E2I14_10440 [Sapientia aquatica]